MDTRKEVDMERATIKTYMYMYIQCVHIIYTIAIYICSTTSKKLSARQNPVYCAAAVQYYYWTGSPNHSLHKQSFGPYKIVS